MVVDQEHLTKNTDYRVYTHTHTAYQMLSEWDPAICVLTSASGDSDVQGLKTTGLNQGEVQRLISLLFGENGTFQSPNESQKDMV